MKKSLLALAVGLMATASSMDAAKVYFENTDNWSNVTTWNFGGPGSDVAGTTTQVTIGTHTLYEAELVRANIIFRNSVPGNDWANKTIDIESPADGSVWDAASTHVANIVNGEYVATGNVAPDKNTLFLLNSTDGWSAKSSCQMSEENGVFTITRSFEAGTFFKIGNLDWSTVYGGDPEVGNNDSGSTLTQIQAGESYTLFEGTSTKNLYIPASLDNVTFTFNKASKTLTLSTNGDPDPTERFWYCAWDFEEKPEGASWVFGNKMEAQEGEEGIYKIHVDCTDSASENNFFALFRGVTNNNWNDGTRYQPKDKATGNAYTENVEVNTDETFPIIQGTQACWTLGNGSWTIVLDASDPNNVSLSFDLGDSTGEANVLIDRVADTQYDGIYESYALTPVEGKEHVYTYTGSLNSGDKLKFNIHGKDYYYDPSIGTILTDDFDADDTLTIDYPLTEGEGDVIFNYTSNVVITVDVPNEKVTVDIADAPRVAMYVTNGEESKVIRVVRQENTRIYKAQYEAKAGDQIDFRLLNVRYECEFNDPASTEANGDKVYNLIVPDDEKTAPEFTLEPGVYNFTINANANNATTAADETKTLTLSKVGEPTPDPDPEPTYDNEFYVRGNIFGVTSWSDEKMTYTDGKFVLANKTVVTGAFGIKEVDPTITEGDNQVHWYSAANAADADVVLDKVIDLKINGSNLNLYAGTYTFTFDPEALTLTVVGTQTEFPQEGFDGWTVTLAGNHNEFNSTDPNYTANVSEDGKAQLSIIGLNAESGFKFVVNKPNETWYGITDPIEFGKKLTLGDTGMSNSVIPNANPKYKYTFDVDLSSKPYTVVITQDTSTGISEISLDAEDAVFFNLQGVKVEKPENGLYIVVRNGKSQKVMVK